MARLCVAFAGLLVAASEQDPLARLPSSDCRALVEDLWKSLPEGNGDLENVLSVARKGLSSLPLMDALSCAEAALAASRPENLMQTARFVEEAARHPVCLEDLEKKSEAETRCVQKWYKIAIHSLSVHGLAEEAEAMWRRATSLRTAGGQRAIHWPTPLQTPTVWVNGLQSEAFWDCSRWPFLAELEAAAPLILGEIRRAAAGFVTAYPYLTKEGTWQDLFLYRGSEWNASLCQELPQTCRFLLPEMPTRPGIPYTTIYNEEVVIFRSEPGAIVGSHCGASNAVINLHLTLTGARATTLRVGNEQVQLQDGKAVCFQDSFFHGIHHGSDGDAERISLVMRVMHPMLQLETYGASKRTDVVPSLADWDVAASLTAEVERLRREYRKLAAEVSAADVTCNAMSPCSSR